MRIIRGRKPKDGSAFWTTISEYKANGNVLASVSYYNGKMEVRIRQESRNHQTMLEVFLGHEELLAILKRVVEHYEYLGE